MELIIGFCGVGVSGYEVRLDQHPGLETVRRTLEEGRGNPFFEVDQLTWRQCEPERTWVVVHDAPKLATGGANPQVFVTNIEDTVALADADLRRDFEHGFPEAWRRIQLRRNFMKDTLRIDLPPEVLPFSNIPAWLPPFLLSPARAFVAAG